MLGINGMGGNKNRKVVGVEDRQKREERKDEKKEISLF